MEPTEKEIQEIKAVLEKTHKRGFTLEEATKAAWDLRAFAEIALNAGMAEWKRAKRLEEMPKGFHIEGSGTCAICNGKASNENSWFDKHGLKCMKCQNAIFKKLIPASIAKDSKAWYTKYELEKYFNLKGKFLNQCIKEGFLKDRKIPGKCKSIHLQLFLMKDNKGILPPKELLKSRIVKVMRNDEEYFTSEYWYEFVEEKLAKKIAKYQIADLFPFTFSQPIETGRLWTKNINPLFMPSM